LTAIPGVGEKRKNRLLRNFGSINRVASASVAELTPFAGRKTAEEISEHFSRQRALAEGAQEDADAETRGRVDAAREAKDEAAMAREARDDFDEEMAIASGDVVTPETVETNLVDPEGNAEDLQPVSSVNHAGEVRPLKRKRRKRSTNPHAIRKEKLSDSEREEA